MIAVDTSAIVAIGLNEPDEVVYTRRIADGQSLVGATTLVEAGLVLSRQLPLFADTFLRGLLARRSVRVVDFSAAMYETAVFAFRRYGKGQGHPAQLNFGDCLSYAVAKVHDVPLLYKGDDFGHTDIRPALPR